MNFSGHVLWKRRVIGVCARAIIGKPRVVAPAAAPVVRKRRRICSFGTLSVFSSRFIQTSQYLLRVRFTIRAQTPRSVYAFSFSTFAPATKPALFAKMFGLR